MTFTRFSPAKLNLNLHVTGRLDNDYHELVSLVTPVSFGDRLTLAIKEDGQGEDTLQCTDPAIPTDSGNLVLKAARQFRNKTGFNHSCHWILDKKIPAGAGLGGGSSNATTALKLLNKAISRPLDSDSLKDLAISAGADCALFLQDKPVIMRGIGDHLKTLPEKSDDVINQLRFLICKPDFEINTAHAYGLIRRTAPEIYADGQVVESQLNQWLEGCLPTEHLFENTFEKVLFKRYLCYPALAGILCRQFDLSLHLTGSGSACFIPLKCDTVFEQVANEIKKCWGSDTFLIETFPITRVNYPECSL